VEDLYAVRPRPQGLLPVGRVGIRFIEKARALGVKVICVHKGCRSGRIRTSTASASDIGVVAKRFPDVAFLIYHSGFVTTQKELPYDHDAKRDGIDTLIRSLVDTESSRTRTSIPSSAARGAS
jgi:predicted TIM-barrel fold metal-dependent hydrolase